mgnify:CR=1 FL=1
MHPMNRRRLTLALASLAAAPALAAFGGAAAHAQSRPAAAAREISWLDLVPPDWKPQERIDRRRAESLKDDDELAQELMRELREILDTAPTVDRFDGAAVKLPGYVVPLERADGGLTEFLLVPYYGACIHVPPPPANQIVHIKSRQPVKGFDTMSAVWVSGLFRSERHDSGMGVSGYSMDLQDIQRFVPPGGN